MDHRTPSVLIAARREGFRRCGIAHPAEPVLYAPGYWSEAQLEELRAEPHLVVTLAPDAAPAAEPPEGVFEAALEALRAAPAAEVRAFVRRMEDDPEIWGKVFPDPDLDPEPELTREERLAAAVGQLEAGNPDHFNKDGTTPSIAALEALTGLDDITASERDAAHVAHLEAVREAD